MLTSILGPIVQTALRHGANALGTWLIATGFVSEGDAQTLMGAVIILGSLAWSLVNGINKAK